MIPLTIIGLLLFIGGIIWVVLRTAQSGAGNRGGSPSDSSSGYIPGVTDGGFLPHTSSHSDHFGHGHDGGGDSGGDSGGGDGSGGGSD